MMSGGGRMDALEECHSRLARLLGPGAEPIEVLRQAEAHRAYWRPEQVRVVLLAESHVYTTTPESERRVILPRVAGLDVGEVPRGFVRLVYCLGYGENGLLDRPILDPKNAGTPQFWKIFYSCLHRVSGSGDFVSLQSQTPIGERVRNKLALLQRLKEAGVWLVDASVAALYIPRHEKPSAVLETALQTSWDTYVGGVVKEAHPAEIVCIGKGVAQALGHRLGGLKIPVTVVPQPNARLSSEEHLGVFRQYYDIVQTAHHQ
jgi:hypothetical protein